MVLRPAQTTADARISWSKANHSPHLDDTAPPTAGKSVRFPRNGCNRTTGPCRQSAAVLDQIPCRPNAIQVLTFRTPYRQALPNPFIFGAPPEPNLLPLEELVAKRGAGSKLATRWSKSKCVRSANPQSCPDEQEMAAVNDKILASSSALTMSGRLRVSAASFPFNQ